MDELALAGLVSSRICHDLISPVGAVGNGLELLAMAQTQDGGVGAATEEMQLLSDSSATASATLRFLRLAFGARADDEMISGADLEAATKGYFRQRRVSFTWREMPAGLPAPAARLTLLLALAAASTLPRGGSAALTAADADPLKIEWTLSGEPVAPTSMEAVLMGRPGVDIRPGDVHLAIIAMEAKRRGGAPFWEPEDGRARIGVR